MQNETKVKTNQGYFDKLGRVIYGTVENNIDQNNPAVTVIRVSWQEGNIIPEHDGQLLMVMLEDLEIVMEGQYAIHTCARNLQKQSYIIH